MASGVYRLNATCDDEVLNTVAADGYFSVRSRIPLSITLFPCATSSTFGNASGLQKHERAHPQCCQSLVTA
eukprot:scaffold66212_cov17-Tisochrysis_lutea.AAC.1